MKEQGQVVNIDNDIVTLAFIKGEQCDSCGSSFCQGKERVFTAKNAKGLPLSIGDTVEVELPTGRTIRASFSLLIVPLLLFVILYMTTERIAPESGEGLKVIIGTMGLAVGLGFPMLRKLYRQHAGDGKLFAGNERYPEITAKV